MTNGPDEETERGAFYYNDAGGEPQDSAIHDELLQNPQMDTQIALASIKLAIENGFTEQQAMALYGTDELRNIYADSGKVPGLEPD